MDIDTEKIIEGILFIAVILVLFNWIYRPYIIEQSIQEKLQKITQKNLNDPQTIYYAELCKNGTNINEQAQCIMTQTKEKYKYTKDQERKEIRTPTQYAILGGNCKDSAIFYATIFKKLNYTVKFRFPTEKHVDITINKKINNNTYEYCDIEGNTADCHTIIT